ncbi:MAG: peptidoglycan DD-metalloendopeptidase family protein [Bacilli bacterium]|nr:peptidoglycan DD-metalloendopeptidase family protein [Bacilli bacterium]
MKKQISIISIGFSILMVLLIICSLSIKGEINYGANEAYYQKLCNKRSSYNANKTVCQGYERYLKNQAANSKQSQLNLKEEIENTKGDISKLLDLIKKNSVIIEEKKKQIIATKNNIQAKEKEIKALENEVLERLTMMQEMNTENFVVDFLMSSNNLDDFLTKMDGINAINDANNQVIHDLDDIKVQLKKKQVELQNSKKELEESQNEQKTMLKDYYSKEAELFTKLQAEQKNNAVYNSKLNNININDVTGGKESKGFVNPVAHAVVTAAAWYYPADFGGGWHPGVDLANNYGTPIHAPANGVVLATGNGMGYGNYMLTAHQVGNTTWTFLYGHLNGYASFGSTIKQGQVIAYMGSTGNSTGPHLHFEVYRHTGQSLRSVIDQYRSTGDVYFGLGYTSIGSCSNVCRLKPHEFLGLRYGQSY